MMQGYNKHLQYVLNMCALDNCLSHSGLNHKRIEGGYGLILSELMLRPHNITRHKMHGQYNDSRSIQGEEWIISLSVILELMDCKRGMATCGLSYHEICALFEIVCID